MERTGYKQWARAQNTHLRMGPLNYLFMHTGEGGRVLPGRGEKLT